MLAKREEFKKAVNLRKKGKSYSEIAKLISVSESTLSLWLRKIQLSSEQYQILNSRQREGQIKGALIRKQEREENQKYIIQKL